jgi:hypothetical protein
MQFLDYDEIPERWRPKPSKYDSFLHQVGKSVTLEKCKFWNGEKGNSLGKIKKKRNRVDRIQVNGERSPLENLCVEKECINPIHFSRFLI